MNQSLTHKNINMALRFFGLFFIVILVLSSCNDLEELKEFGIITTAKVINGESRKKGSSTTYKVDLKFTLQNGETKTVTEYVSSSEYNKLYIDAEIPIVYSSNDYTKLEPILTDDAVQTFLGINNMPLSITNLFEVYNSNFRDSITTYLNTISYKWNEGVGELGIPYWENNNKDELVALNDNVLTFVTYSYTGHQQLIKDLDREGFIKISKDSTNTTIYQNEEYKLSSSQEMDTDKNKIGLSLYWVVNLIKEDVE